MLSQHGAVAPPVRAEAVHVGDGPEGGELEQHPYRHHPGVVPLEVPGVLVAPKPRDLGPEPGEHLVLLLHVRREADRPRDDAVAAEVEHRREVRLAPGLDWTNSVTSVASELLPGAARGEVAAEQVLERLADPAHIGAVRAVPPPAPYAAPEPDLPHQLEDRLVGYPDAELGPEAHRHLPVPAAVFSQAQI